MLIWNGVLVAAVILQRLSELVLSARNRRRMFERGAAAVSDPVFPWMVATHVVLLAGCLLEPWLLERPFLPWLGWPALGLLVLAQALRVWTIRTLGRHWNTRIVASATEDVVTAGPYRWVRHPNYLVLILEFVTLPLFHSAWITLAVAHVLHVPVLSLRIRAEESYLLGLPAYRAAMAKKPRFLAWPRRRLEAR